MKHKLLFQALIDGILSAIGLISLEWLITSVLFANVYSTMPLIFASVTPAILLSVVYLLFLRSKKSTKELICFSLISVVMFIFVMIISFVHSLTIHVQVPFQRELSNADGFLIVITSNFYLLTLIILKLIILICQITKKQRSKSLTE